MQTITMISLHKNKSTLMILMIGPCKHWNTMIVVPCVDKREKMSKSFSALRQTQKPFRCRAPNSKSNLHKSFRTYFNCETSSSYIQLKVKMVGYLRLLFIFARLKNYAQRRWRMHNAFKMQNCLLRTFSKIKLAFFCSAANNHGKKQNYL